MKHVPYLDGWRGLAVLCVLFGHFVTSEHINLARLGVELFFVLSGRLMAEMLFVREKRLSIFFPRRFSRVYPALFVFVTAMFAVAWSRGIEPTAPQALAALTFTANYLDPITGRSGALDHIWSLCIEEHMYLLLGLVAFLHRRRHLPLIPMLGLLAAAAMLNGLARTLAGGDYFAVYWRTDVRGASLLLGVLAYISLRKVNTAPWFAPILFVGGFALNFNIVPDPIKYSLGSSLLACSVVFMKDAAARVLAFFEHPMMMHVGLWSYSIYLWQQPFAKFHVGLGGHLILLIPVFVAALISYNLIEQPARDWLNRGLAARRTSPAAKA